MNAPERLRQAIDDHQRLFRADVPADRPAAILALLRLLDRRQRPTGVESSPDLITGRHVANLGNGKALRLCFDLSDGTSTAPGSPKDGWDAWGERFLQRCGWLAEAELVLTHCETGLMRIVADRDGAFDAWVTTKRPPTSWRERADIDWWALWLAKRHESEMRFLQSERPSAELDEVQLNAFYRRVADVRLNTMAYQLSYPPDATIGGCGVQTYRNVLGLLIGWALRWRDRGESATPQSEQSLVAQIAANLAIDLSVAQRAVAAFTLDSENAAYHSAVPGAAAAPLVRVGHDQLVWSVHGLTTEPFFFLTRELKRRAAEEYHNAAYQREDVFRQDLYGIFPDKRFVTAAGRIQLRRDKGDLRTDIDAVIFDRKTGALGIFELKSQDPFARSAAELTRQRDNVLYANRQISGALAWIQQHGADEILNRVDRRTAKTFRVWKVFPFVLGRYVAHFSDGPEPDRRAAWGTWPQVLRLLDGQTARASEANPLASLFSRLSNDGPPIILPADQNSYAIALGTARLVVHPSYAAYQERGAVRQGASSGKHPGA